ncbi:MAG TPA: CDP-alcohol phosphatidyltransferase [Pedococcus sp.]
MTEGQPSGRRTGALLRRAVASVMAGLLLWFALTAPTDPAGLSPAPFVRLPAEALLAVALLLVLPAGARRTCAVAVGLVLGAVAIVKVLDLGFRSAFRRPFEPVTDWTYVGSSRDLLSDTIGPAAAVLVLALTGAAMVGVLVLLPRSVLRLSRGVEGHRPTAVRVVAGLTLVWIACAATGAELVPGTRVASASAATLASDHWHQSRAALRDREDFARAVAVDRFGDTASRELLTGLRGKDVLVVFVESYGEVAVQGSPVSQRISPTLDAGTARLRAAGYSTRSAWLTSPTFGGLSWLAHSTLQSGLWVDSQARHDALLEHDRLTLSGAFRAAGWRTVGQIPANRRDWPEGKAFYRWDQLYDSRNVGYAGPPFGYATMPDQYTLKVFFDRELARPDRPPVMAEIDLVTSHLPWTPLPRLVDWDDVGDGSGYAAMRAASPSEDVVWGDPRTVRAAYARAISYSIETVVSFVEWAQDHDLVLVVLGDHQPATVVSGERASHRVPATVIARDPAVVERISGWGWRDGLRPDPRGPVWGMDAFRDRFLSAYGPVPGAPPGASRR